MVDQSTLLQLLQFTGLITPAIAILAELLIGFHGGMDSIRDGGSIPGEVQILLLGFSGILAGGLIIGFQLIQTLNNGTTQLGASLLFIGLPLLALSILILNLRISGISTPGASLTKQAITGVQIALSIVVPLILSASVLVWPIVNYQDWINTQFNWWVFRASIGSSWYFAGTGLVLTYDVMYQLWLRGLIPSSNADGPIYHGTVITMIFIVAYLAFTAPVFGVYKILSIYNIPFFTPTSPLSSIPFIWGAIVLIAFLRLEVEYDSLPD